MEPPSMGVQKVLRWTLFQTAGGGEKRKTFWCLLHLQDMTALVMQSKDSITQLIQNKADLAEIENELFTRKEQAKTQVRKAVQDLMK